MTETIEFVEPNNLQTSELHVKRRSHKQKHTRHYRIVDDATNFLVGVAAKGALRGGRSVHHLWRCDLRRKTASDEIRRRAQRQSVALHREPERRVARAQHNRVEVRNWDGEHVRGKRLVQHVLHLLYGCLFGHEAHAMSRSTLANAEEVDHVVVIADVAITAVCLCGKFF